MVCLVSIDDEKIEVLEEVAMEIPLIKEKMMNLVKGEEETYRLPWITMKNLVLLIDYITHQLDNSPLFTFEDHRLDIVSVFNLIQAAYFLEIKGLMDFMCQLLVKKVKLNPVEEIFQGFMGPERKKRDEAMFHSLTGQHDSHILRNRRKLTFIDDSDFVDVQYSPFVRSQLLFIKRWQSTFADHCREVVESKSIEPLSEALNRLEKLVMIDLRSDYFLTARVAMSLVKILKRFEYRTDIQFPVITILSHARSIVCQSVVEEHIIPALVNLLFGQWSRISISAVNALTRLAYTSPKGIKVMVERGALEPAHVEVKNASGGYDSIVSLANFLAAICRGYSLSPDNLPSDKVGLVHSILVVLIEHKYGYHDLHIARACNALSYLSYGRCLEIEGHSWYLLAKNLSGFLNYVNPFIADSLFKYVAMPARDKNLGMMIAGSALGVIGNVARWGTVKQIQFLSKYTLPMSYFRSLLCSEFKNFRKETCQIISNLAAQSGDILIKDLVYVELIEVLCDMLENDEPEVKMEAVWAVFNCIGGYNKYEEINEYPQMVVFKEKEPSLMG